MGQTLSVTSLILKKRETVPISSSSVVATHLTIHTVVGQLVNAKNPAAILAGVKFPSVEAKLPFLVLGKRARDLTFMTLTGDYGIHVLTSYKIDINLLLFVRKLQLKSKGRGFSMYRVFGCVQENL